MEIVIELSRLLLLANANHEKSYYGFQLHSSRVDTLKLTTSIYFC